MILHSQTTSDRGGLDVDIDRSPPDAESTARSNPYVVMLRHWWRLLLAIVVVGATLALVHDRLPFLRPGSRVMETAKLDYVTTPGLFDVDGADGAVQVAVMGNSRVLAGFVPAVFDDAMSCATRSVNAGFPAAVDFVPDLVAMVDAGNLPDVVLVQRPWGFADAFDADGSATVADRWLDARFLLRDVSAFVDEAGGPAGVFDHYRVGQDAVTQMEADRGWYFIEGESLYDDDRLPDDLVVPDDQPDTEFVRTVPLTGPSYRAVERLVDQGVEFIFVPNPEREGAFAPPSSEVSPLAEALADVAGLSVAGPELNLYPNALFADPVHLNPEGAAAWSADLAELVDGRVCGTD